nr:protein FAM50A-like [Nicotiana tomentosiformis]
MANLSVSQLQQKLEMIEKLREEVDVIKAEPLKWKGNMDHFSVEKKVVRAQLSSAESQLQNIKEKSLVQARKTEDLEARLAFELAKAEKTKADSDAFVAVYRADAEAAQSHAREAKELEADAGALAYDDDNDDDDDDDDDGDESKSGSQSGEEPDGEKTAPIDN